MKVAAESVTGLVITLTEGTSGNFSIILTLTIRGKHRSKNFAITGVNGMEWPAKSSALPKRKFFHVDQDVCSRPRD